MVKWPKSVLARWWWWWWWWCGGSGGGGGDVLRSDLDEIHNPSILHMLIFCEI